MEFSSSFTAMWHSEQKTMPLEFWASETSKIDPFGITRVYYQSREFLLKPAVIFSIRKKRPRPVLPLSMTEKPSFASIAPAA
jgi:hypothetical protein